MNFLAKFGVNFEKIHTKFTKFTKPRSKAPVSTTDEKQKIIVQVSFFLALF